MKKDDSLENTRKKMLEFVNMEEVKKIKKKI